MDSVLRVSRPREISMNNLFLFSSLVNLSSQRKSLAEIHRFSFALHVCYLYLGKW